MKTEFISLALATLTLTASAIAQAQLKQGGIHDGGGQGVMLKNVVIGIADRYRPVIDSKSFVPDGARPVNPLSKYAGLEVEVDKLAQILDVYTERNPRYDSGEIRLSGPVDLNLEFWNIKKSIVADSKRKYFLVRAFPDISGCRVERDNSGLPVEATVSHIACTQGSTTLLLDDGSPFAFKNLNAKTQADILAHEAYRTAKIPIETSRIEKVVGGLSIARDIGDRQEAGERKPLTSDELAILTGLQKEIGPRPVVERDAFRTIWPNGGGLVVAPERFDPSAFIGIGSFVHGDVKIIEKNVEILRSQIGFRDQEMPANTIEEGARIEDSTLKALELRIGRSTHFKNVKLELSGLDVGENSEITNSDIQWSYNPAPPHMFKLGSRVVIKDSSLKTLMNMDRLGLEDAIPFVMESDSQLLSSSIDYSRSYVQGSGSRIEGLNLRVRPRNGGWHTFSAIEVEAGAQVHALREVPIVLFASYSPFSNSVIKLAGAVNIYEWSETCKMGYDPETGTEWGAVVKSITLGTYSGPVDCEESENLKIRRRVPGSGYGGVNYELLSRRR